MVNQALNDNKLSKHMDNITQLSALVETIDKVKKADQTSKQKGKVKEFFFLHLTFTYNLLLCMLIYHPSHQMRKFFHSQRISLSIIMLRGQAAAQPINFEIMRESISTPTATFPKTQD